MGGIHITGKHKATAKAASALASYLFEEEFGELTVFTKDEVGTLKKACLILNKHV